MTVLNSAMPSVDRPPKVSRTTAQKVTPEPTKPSSILGVLLGRCIVVSWTHPISKPSIDITQRAGRCNIRGAALAIAHVREEYVTRALARCLSDQVGFLKHCRPWSQTPSADLALDCVGV